MTRKKRSSESELTPVDKWVNEVQEMRKEHAKEVGELRRALADEKAQIAQVTTVFELNLKTHKELESRLREAEELLKAHETTFWNYGMAKSAEDIQRYFERGATRKT